MISKSTPSRQQQDNKPQVQTKMTGRFNGRANGRGRSSRGSGRGGGHGRNQGSSRSGTRPRRPDRKLQVFHPDTIDNPKYDDTAQIIMDMATSLRANPEWIDCPEITAAIEAVEHKRPTEPTKPTRDPTTKEYDELLLSAWKTEYAEWKKKVKAYDQMANAAAALIFTKYCSKEMQTKLRALEDYEEKVKLDPVEMLKRIKALVSAGTTRQHPMVRFV